MSRNRTSLAILFWTKVNREGPSVCWEWLGAKTEDGQGVMSVWFEDEAKWKMKTVSHIAIYLTYGFWPRMAVRRTCGNSICVNTLHMKLD